MFVKPISEFEYKRLVAKKTTGVYHKCVQCKKRVFI